MQNKTFRLFISSPFSDFVPLPNMQPKKISKTSYSESSNYSSNYVSKKKDDYMESKPPISTYTLSKNQLLYCEAEMIRLDIVENKIDKYSQKEVDKFNSLTDDYNARCSQKKYYKNDMYKVNKLIKNRKSKIEEEGLDRFNKSINSTNTVTIDKMLFNPKPSKVSGNCKVTIFKDGSIGAELNGVFKQWNTMSSWERSQCDEELKVVQKKTGRKVNTSKIQTGNSKKKEKYKYPLTVKTVPSDARVMIMNIKPKYYDGIRLVKGKYKIRVVKKGYMTQNHIFDPSEKSTYTVILKKKKNNISYSKKTRSKNSSNNGLPANAKLNYLGNGWECKRGYYRSGNQCYKVKLPANAKLNYLGNGWECKRGYYRSQNQCYKVGLPANAKLNYLGNGWECKRGYYSSGNQCVRVGQ
jgi:hypothetical protein